MALNAFQAKKEIALSFNPMPYMNEYLAELDANGRNVDYIRTCRNSLAHFANFCLDNGIVHPGELERVHLIRFQAHCQQQEWSQNYRISILNKVRQWLNWLESLDYIFSNPWLNIKIPQMKKQPKPLSDEEVELLFRAHRRGAFSLSPFPFHRREAILCLLYAWGLRIHELEALNVSSMDFSLDFVVVRNKGGTVKTLPYTAEIKKILRRWISVRSQYGKREEDALLITNTGERLEANNIRRVISDLGAEAGITINPHRLRDTCGTHLLDSDMPLERAAMILGHSKSEMTLRYAKVNDRKVAESLTLAMDPRLKDLFSNTRDLAK